MAGAAYARATDGVIFNDQDSRSRTASESMEVVRNIEHPSQTYEEARRDIADVQIANERLATRHDLTVANSRSTRSLFKAHDNLVWH
jgi:hypothetical protein